MNGVHDLGGMHGFGKVEVEPNEPVFHADWERMVRAISGATRARKLFTLDEFRYAIERMEPAHYLGSSYYEHWLDGLCRVLEEKGVIEAGDLEARTEFFQQHPDAPARAVMQADPPADVPSFIDRSAYSGTPLTEPPRFKVGDPIITRNSNPIGHTRLPRYARGKHGVIARIHGAFILPDVHAHGKGAPTEPVYSVCFEGRELWGDSTEPNQRVYLDCWESYLLPGEA